LEAAGLERPFVSEEQVARERQAIAEASRARLAGVSWGEITRQWNAAGLRTPRGNLWQTDKVRRTLDRPLNAGLVAHEGAVVGRLPGEAMVEEAVYSQVHAHTVAQRRGRVAGQQYLGSGMVRCGVCGHGLSGKRQYKERGNRAERRVYFCPAHRGGCGKVATNVVGGG
jgi:hypothetical protein